jgi:hypothetical protein
MILLFLELLKLISREHKNIHFREKNGFQTSCRLELKLKISKECYKMRQLLNTQKILYPHLLAYFPAGILFRDVSQLFDLVYMEIGIQRYLEEFIYFSTSNR